MQKKSATEALKDDNCKVQEQFTFLQELWKLSYICHKTHYSHQFLHMKKQATLAVKDKPTITSDLHN